MTDRDFMQVAIETARRGLTLGEMPFGSCLVRQGRVVTAQHNSARRNRDITAHAEMQVIRESCRLLKTLDLSGCVLYTSCEPCPMCFSACFWAKIPRVVYASRIEDAERAGIRQLPIEAARMKEMSRAAMDLTADVLREDGVELLTAWGGRASGARR